MSRSVSVGFWMRSSSRNVCSRSRISFGVTFTMSTCGFSPVQKSEAQPETRTTRITTQAETTFLLISSASFPIL